jgi:hypothetical protein
MKKSLSLIVSVVLLALSGYAQADNSKVKASGSSSPTATSPVDLAKAALAAHGGEKLRGIKSLVLRGSVGLTTSAFPQALAGTFAMIFAGEKYRLDLNNPVQPISQVFDGVNTQTTIQNGFELPPINRIGFFMLSKVGDASFPISALPAESKKKNGFRITSPEGFYTDYLVDEKTGLLKGYESSYDMNGHIVTTSVAIDKCRLVEGVLVPEKFSQRFDLGQLTAYADFKAKDIMVNTEIANEIFTIQK